METVTLRINGMACGGCANTVTQVLQALDGVVEVGVSHTEARATVSYDPARVAPEQLKAAVETAGYTVVD